eukprot:363649-Chlamydomonas_euryale.AAC.2
MPLSDLLAGAQRHTGFDAWGVRVAWGFGNARLGLSAVSLPCLACQPIADSPSPTSSFGLQFDNSVPYIIC